MEEKINMHELTELVRRFVACGTHLCSECPYKPDCKSEMDAGWTSIADRMTRILAKVLPALEHYEEVTAEEFVDLISHYNK